MSEQGLTDEQLIGYCKVHSKRMQDEGFAKTAWLIDVLQSKLIQNLVNGNPYENICKDAHFHASMASCGPMPSAEKDSIYKDVFLRYIDNNLFIKD